MPLKDLQSRSELLHDRSRIHVTMVQLPAINTPQFDWVKSRLPNRAQPVPPIYQPEVAAKAIYGAAHHRRREVKVGGKTATIIWGNRFLPGLGDWYLSRVGYCSQQTNEPEDPNRPYNLWEPPLGDPGAHGRFGMRALEKSVQFWITSHSKSTTLGFIAGVGLAYILSRRSYKETETERGDGKLFLQGAGSFR